MNILRLVDKIINISDSNEENGQETAKEFSKYNISSARVDIPVKDMELLMHLFNDRVHDILPEYFKEIEHEKNNHESFKEKYFSPIDSEVSTIKVEHEYRDDVRELKDFCTDMINSQIFSHTGAYSFMYIVNKMHKTIIDLYET